MTGGDGNGTPEPVGSLQHVAVLRDGAEAVVRDLAADDVDAVVALVDALDDRERYLRFFTSHPRYVDEWATSITDPHRDGATIGAFDHGELVGVANFVPCTQAVGVEMSVLVAHDQHDRGVGTILLRDLASIARKTGHRRLVADVLVENNGLRRVLVDAGVPVTWHRDGPVYSCEVDLDAVLAIPDVLARPDSV